jgi:hypothetical protein
VTKKGHGAWDNPEFSEAIKKNSIAVCGYPHRGRRVQQSVIVFVDNAKAHNLASTKDLRSQQFLATA